MASYFVLGETSNVKKFLLWYFQFWFVLILFNIIVLSNNSLKHPFYFKCRLKPVLHVCKWKRSILFINWSFFILIESAKKVWVSRKLFSRFQFLYFKNISPKSENSLYVCTNFEKFKPLQFYKLHPLSRFLISSSSKKHG